MQRVRGHIVQSPPESDWSIWDHVNTPPHTSNFRQAITLSISTTAMPNKTARKELSSETIAVILTLHKLGYTASQISKEEGLSKGVPKSTITFQIRRAKKHQNDPFVKAIRTGRPPKLGARAERRLVRHMALNPFDTLSCLSTPGKSGCRMHINTTRKYLAKNEYYAF